MAVAFLTFSLVLVSAAYGWFRRRRWGWMLAVGIIATQVVGDFVNIAIGRVLEGTFGVVVAGLLLFWLLRPNVRAAFPHRDRPFAVSEL